MRCSLLLLLLALWAVGGSFQCEKGCYDGSILSFRHTNWQTAALDNSGPEPVESGTMPVARSAFGLRMSAPTALIDPASNVISDCPPAYLADTAIVAVRIFTYTAFDAQHPAGAEISDYFKVRIPGSSLSNVQYDDVFRAPDLLNTYAPTSSADLLLLTPPALAGLFDFEVQLLRSDSVLIRLPIASVQLF